MQRLIFQRALAAAFLCLAGMALAAEFTEFKFKDGTSVKGEAIGPKERDVVIKDTDGKFLPRTAWTNFTQETLKEFAKNPKMRQYVELLIEDAAPATAVAGGEINIPEVVVAKRDWKQPKDVTDKRVVPKNPSMIAGMFGTGVGWFSMLVVYAGIIYAGFEVAAYRRRPKQLVMGLSAIPIFGFFAPIAFLCMPAVKRLEETKPNSVAQAAAIAAAAAAQKPEEKPAFPGKKKPGLALGKKVDDAGHAPAPVAAPVAVASPVKAPAPAATPAMEAVVYRRGETNINKRFIETKFAGFFKAVLGPAEKEMWVVWVTATGGEFWSKRIVSISQTDVVVNCPQESGGTLDETIQIAGIQEIHLRPREG
ncbi:MAG: hypothetical protein EXS27_01890 [Pedosphaera sp.]|nr:hypothetical protein [Pedosphaera sp.]